MEEINSKKTEAFLTAIKTLADEECKSIDEETDRLRVERLRALQKEAEDRYKSYTEYETARIKADCNSAVSECEERSRKELTDLRAELCKKVFDAAGEKINEYTKTDSYREKLVSSAKEIAEAFDGGDVELFLRKEDLVFSDDLKAIFKNGCVVTESDDIVYGGLRTEKRTALPTILLIQNSKSKKNGSLNIRDFPSRSDIFVRECNIRYQRPCRYHKRRD